MRKLLLTGGMLLLVLISSARQVSRESAEIIAINWMKSVNMSVSSENVTSVFEKKQDGHVQIYIVMFSPIGWAMVSGNDKTEPILAYSKETSIDFKRLPSQFEDWIDGIGEEIDVSFSPDYQADKNVNVKWDLLQSDEGLPPLKAAQNSVSPLLSCKWDQGEFFNEMAPEDASSSAGNGHVWIGCVATAAAQVMKFWEFPEVGRGQYSYSHEEYGIQSADFGTTNYNWALMPDKLFGPNEDVQLISYHAAVAVKMDFDPYGSGAYLADAENAFVDYFKYNTSVYEANKSHWDSDALWKENVRNELDNGRPVIYAGYNAGLTSGHAFVCDGYEGEYFHFNWGWGGTANGNFLLSALNPQGANYTYQQSALFGIEPIQTVPIETPFSEGFEGSGTEIARYGVSEVITSEKHSGEQSLRLSKPNFSSVSKNMLSTTFNVPVSGNLNFWIKRFSPDTIAENVQAAYLFPEYGDEPLLQIFEGSFHDNDWVNYSVDLTAYAGQIIRFQLIQQNFNVVKEQWMLVDDIVVTGVNQNLAPYTPNSPIPGDQQQYVSLSPTLYWNGGDPNGTPVSYKVYFGESENPGFFLETSVNKLEPGELKHRTNYYWKIIADDGSLETEGPVWSFQTQGIPPEIDICGISNISSSTATLCGEITNDNGSIIEEKGFVWSKHQKPTVYNNFVKNFEINTQYESEISGLEPYQKYYVAAYGRTEDGIGYSEDVSFRSAADIPLVSAIKVDSIYRKQAKFHGYLEDINDSLLLAYGVVWSEDSLFSSENTDTVRVVSSISEPGALLLKVDELTGPDTLYYKFFAENSVGVSYSQVKNFTTINHVPEIDLDADNSSGQPGYSFQGSVSEQMPDGKIADDDVFITDEDGDVMTQLVVILKEQLYDQQEYIVFQHDDRVQVEGNYTDTLILTNVGVQANEVWEELLGKVFLFIDHDAPQSEVKRLVETYVFDGYDQSLPATSFMYPIEMNDPPQLMTSQEVKGNLILNDYAFATEGDWQDVLDECDATFSFSYRWQLDSGDSVFYLPNEINDSLKILEEYCGSLIRFEETVFDENCGGTNLVSNTTYSEWVRIDRLPQTVEIDPFPPLQYSANPIIVNGSASSGLAIEYATNSQNLFEIKGDSLYTLATGTGVIYGIQPGNSCYFPSEKVYRIINVEKGTQEIIYEDFDTIKFSSDPIVLNASSTAGLGLEVRSSNPAVAEYENGNMQLKGIGIVELELRQDGNEFMEAAEDVRFTFVVVKGDQVIQVEEEKSVRFGNESLPLKVDVSSGLLPTVVSSNENVAVWDSEVLWIKAAGDCEIQFSQPGNEFYNAANDAVLKLTVLPGSQKINLEFDAPLLYGLEAIEFEISNSASLESMIQSLDAEVISVENHKIKLEGAGKARLSISNDGNQNWTSLDTIVYLSVEKGIQKTELEDTLRLRLDQNPHALNYSVNSGLTPDLSIDNAEIATVLSGELKLIETGQTKLILSQPGDKNWEAYSSVHVLIVEKGFQHVEAESAIFLTYGDGGYALQASAGSGLKLNYEFSREGLVEIKNDTLFCLSAGNVNVLLSQSGDQNWHPSDTVLIAVNIEKAEQQIETQLPDTLITKQSIAFTDFISSSALEVDGIRSSNESIIRVGEDGLSILDRGEVTLVVSQSGNENYKAASESFDFFVVYPMYDERNEQARISLYPNPSQGFILLELNENIQLPLQLLVYTLNGQKIKTFELNELKNRIDTKLPAGVYNFRIQNREAEWSSRVLVE